MTALFWFVVAYAVLFAAFVVADSVRPGRWLPDRRWLARLIRRDTKER